MKSFASLFVLALMLLPAAARAQARVHITVGVPAAPALVVVQPGVQVVEDQDEEIFFTNGWYWVQRDQVWYRARTPRSAFVYVERRRVPVTLVRLPPGHYRHFRREEVREERREAREHVRRDWRKDREHERHGHERRGD